jgi:cell division inhibitor SulA
MKKELETLLQHPGIWQASAASKPGVGIPSGYAELDKLLHLGGWPTGALTELISRGSGIGELQLLFPALAQLSQQNRWITLISPPYLPCATSWESAGIVLSRLLIVCPRNTNDALWAAEQCLKSKTCSSLLLWSANETTPNKNLRKLQLASQHGDCWTVLFRPESVMRSSPPAALRLAIRHENEHLHIDILKQRNGWGGQHLAIPVNRHLATTWPANRNLPVFIPSDPRTEQKTSGANHDIALTRQPTLHHAMALPSLS